jgi:aminopeptidase N
VWVDFQQSVVMSTYLVAFAVHDFGSVNTVSEDGAVNFRVRNKFCYFDSLTND